MCGRFTLGQPGEVLDETIAALDGLLDERLASRLETAARRSPPGRDGQERSLSPSAEAASAPLEPFADTDTEPIGPRYNVAPTQPVPVLRSTESGISLWTMSWGISRRRRAQTAQRASGRPRGGSRSHINARAESLTEKPTFRDAYRSRRCLILADGFYEWKKSSRQPFFFHSTRRRGLCFAGLWQDGEPHPRHSNASPRPGSGAPLGHGACCISGCCIVTTGANEIVAPIHGRMPVVIEPDAFALWLDPKMSDPETLNVLLKPLAAASLACHPVSRRVNRVAIDDSSLLEPVAEAAKEPENLRLF